MVAGFWNDVVDPRVGFRGSIGGPASAGIMPGNIGGPGSVPGQAPFDIPTGIGPTCWAGAELGVLHAIAGLVYSWGIGFTIGCSGN